MISKEQVLDTAKLCNLTLSDDEVTRLSEMFSDTVSYISVLDELDTSGVEETFQVTGLTNVFQKEDEKETTLSQKEALSNSKNIIKGMFAAKPVFKR